MSDSEEDYDSPSFLVDAPAAPQELSYAERRRRTILEQQAKGKTVSIREQEIEAREEGLRRDLLAPSSSRDGTPQPQNKALAMMMKMGYKHGSSLGAPAVSESDAEESLIKEKAKPGKGLPINIEIREKRAGLGVPQASSSKSSKRTRDPESPPTESEAAAQVDYAAYKAGQHLEKQAFGRLRAVRKTGLELDEREGLGDNFLWLTEEQERDEEEVSEDEALAKKKRRRKTEIDEEEADSDTEADRVREKAGKKKVLRDEDEMERIAAFRKPSSTEQLGQMLEYLRTKHAYCFWCGCQFVDKEDMEINCPGEKEADH